MPRTPPGADSDSDFSEGAAPGGTGDQIGPNVQHADATLRIASDFNCPALQEAAIALRQHGKPSLDLHVDNLPNPRQVVAWLVFNAVVTLNVTGLPSSIVWLTGCAEITAAV